MEAALSDQIPLAQAMKKAYNDAQNKIRYHAMLRLSQAHPDAPVWYDPFYVYGGKYLAYPYYAPDVVDAALEARSENINRIIAAHPDVSFYLYMIDGDSDNYYPAGENNGAFEYLSSRVDLPAEQMGKFAVDELETYERDLPDRPSLVQHRLLPRLPRGSRPARLHRPARAAGNGACRRSLLRLKSAATGAQEQFFEPMDLYRFAFPKMSVTIAGEPADDYGWQDAALSGQLTVPATVASTAGTTARSSLTPARPDAGIC